MCASAWSSSASWRSVTARATTGARGRAGRAGSRSTTWSLRLRPARSRPPSSPSRAMSARSTAVWTSSSAGSGSQRCRPRSRRPAHPSAASTSASSPSVSSPARCSTRGVGPRLLHVVGSQPPVEVRRQAQGRHRVRRAAGEPAAPQAGRLLLGHGVLLCSAIFSRVAHRSVAASGRAQDDHDRVVTGHRTDRVEGGAAVQVPGEELGGPRRRVQHGDVARPTRPARGARSPAATASPRCRRAGWTCRRRTPRRARSAACPSSPAAFTAPIASRSRDSVAWVTWMPSAASSWPSSSCDSTGVVAMIAAMRARRAGHRARGARWTRQSRRRTCEEPARAHRCAPTGRGHASISASVIGQRGREPHGVGSHGIDDQPVRPGRPLDVGAERVP